MHVRDGLYHVVWCGDLCVRVVPPCAPVSCTITMLVVVVTVLLS